MFMKTNNNPEALAKWKAEYTEKDQEILQRLIEAQRAQGNNEPLLTKDQQQEASKKSIVDIVQKLNKYEDSLRTKDYSMDFLPQIDFVNESKKIKNILKSKEYELVFKSSVAT